MLGAAAAEMSAQTSARFSDVSKAQRLPARTSELKSEFETDTWKNIGTGKFSDPAMVNMFNGYTTEEVEVDVEESVEHPGVYRVVTPWPTAPSHPEANYLIVDARDPEYVHIPAQITPVYDATDGVTWICSHSYYGLEIADTKDTKEDFLTYFKQYNITKDGDMITFPAGCVMYMWPDAKSPYALPGEWVSAYMPKYSGYLILPGQSADTPEWQSLGLGEMYDGFLYSFINPAVDAITTNVEVMENTRKPGLYMLTTPFKYVSVNSMDIVIDATNPDFVRFYEQDTGIGVLANGEDWGNMWLYSFSALSSFPTLDAFEAMGYGDLNITLKDNVVNIPAKAIVFFFPKISEIEYYNNDQALDSYIKFPGAMGVEEINRADSGEAPAEYYNLQGVRVENPAPGQLVIRRQGNNVTKMIMR